jgi:hypothetical protein
MANYRGEARRALARAKDELVANDDRRLKYAALELRMAMECLTYDRALAYKDEFPEAEYDTWQPRKVMAVLLEIDPNADKDNSIAFGLEPSYGEQPEVMHFLGTEKVLNMTTLKSHYDALGSYLHMPTVKQFKADRLKVNAAKLRSRCKLIAVFLEDVLSSRVFNSTMGNFGHIDCAECGEIIRKRIPAGVVRLIANCPGCVASYTVVDEENGSVRFEPRQQEISCANPECGRQIVVYEREMELGRCWTCPECHGRNIIRLGISFEPVAAGVPAPSDAS